MERGTTIEVSWQRFAATLLVLTAVTQIACVTVNVGDPVSSRPNATTTPASPPASAQVVPTPIPTPTDGEVLRHIHELMDGRVTFSQLTAVEPEVMLELRKIDELYRSGLADVVQMRLAVARVMSLD